MPSPINRSRPRTLRSLLAAGAVFLPGAAHGKVVINEIFYHAPEELDELEYLELHNASDAPADLSGWAMTKGLKFKFADGTGIPPRGFLVLCRDDGLFRQYYGTNAFGTFSQKLSNDGETIELSDAQRRVVDSVTFSDRAPWPAGADGESGSLERICPDAPAGDPSNWSSSPLDPARLQPGGTPGRPNANWSATLPPAISGVTFTPQAPKPGEAITVEATLREFHGTERMTLLYRALAVADEQAEHSIRMRPAGPGKFSAIIPGQESHRLLRFRVGVRDSSGAARFFPDQNEPAPALSIYIAPPPEAGQIPLAWILAAPGAEDVPRNRRWGGPRWRGQQEEQAPGDHRAAFVYFDPATNRFEVFDFVQVATRPGGWKVRLGKSQPLRSMSTLNITFETPRGVLAEPLAYELYRLAGMAAPQSGHLRLTFNGRPFGYHLFFEQPNRSFLRRNQLRDDGNLYKILWYEDGVIGQHEKKTNVRAGHDDIVALVAALEGTAGEAQWEVIKKNFDLKQVATYFAVNAVLSHWDGFFNNYFTYHDLNGSGKWTMYPWDQDQTWGILNGQSGSVFYKMPLTFGMAGDVPPGGGGGRRGRGDRFAFGQGPSWWRPGGFFSAPLLANPRFRELYLARIREILGHVYTAEIMNPLIDAMGNRLREEVRLRAQISGDDPGYAIAEFEEHLRAFKTHLARRREFLLEQPELRRSAVTYGGESPGR